MTAQIIEMVKEYGIDYFDSALLPLDNFITRGTDHFLGDPDYLTSLNAVRPSCMAHVPYVMSTEASPRFECL